VKERQCYCMQTNSFISLLLTDKICKCNPPLPHSSRAHWPSYQLGITTLSFGIIHCTKSLPWSMTPREIVITHRIFIGRRYNNCSFFFTKSPWTQCVCISFLNLHKAIRLGNLTTSCIFTLLIFKRHTIRLLSLASHHWRW
jgi:hypothetical protein